MMIEKQASVVAIILISMVSPYLALAQPSENIYLAQVLASLEQIESASYVVKITSTAPGDTTPTFVVDSRVREYINPLDTFVGAKFVKFSMNDTFQMLGCYDGEIRTLIYEEEKRMVIDSFKNNRHHPVRPVNAPFFTYMKTLIKYALSTGDPIDIQSINLDNVIQYTFTIPDTVVEMIGNRVVYTPAMYGTHVGDESRYDLWIHKSDNLPFKYKREMPHDISERQVREVKLNQMNMGDFVAADYFPIDFAIQQYGSGKRSDPHAMIGKKAPTWSLQDSDGALVSMDDLKSKVLMIQFTSVTCGPCLASIGFLKTLGAEFDTGDFDFVSIESFNRSPNAIKKYRERNGFEYRFLISNKDVIKDYQTMAVPIFMILDKNRVVRNVFGGYTKEFTDQKIRAAINALL